MEGQPGRRVQPDKSRNSLTAASRATVAIFVLINAAALVRVCASWHTEFMAFLLLVAGACWIAAFGLFELVYGPMLLTRKPDRASGAA